jgi:hypothetical protein
MKLSTVSSNHVHSVSAAGWCYDMQVLVGEEASEQDSR